MVGRELNCGETETEKGREMECCCGWVMAWAINLTVRQIFIIRIIKDLIKMNIKIICKNLDGYYFSLGAVLFYPSVKLPRYTTLVI